MRHTVNILVAVYNGEKYLDALLRSLIEQDYPHITITIRDNCSTDSTPQKLRDWQKLYPEKITILSSKENVGVIGNFAALLQHTQAPYVMFCDHDDVWLPNKVSTTMSKMKEMEVVHGTHTPLLVHTDLTVVDKNLNTIAPSFWKYSHLNTNPACHTFPRLLVQNHITGCTMLINRPLIDLANPIPRDCVMHDWWIALIASCFGHINCVHEATILYRQHGNNDTGAKPYSWIASFKRIAKEYQRYKKGSPNKKNQASIFLDRFESNIPEKHKQMLSAYLDLQLASFPRKIASIIRNGFFKSGFLRNLILDR